MMVPVYMISLVFLCTKLVSSSTPCKEEVFKPGFPRDLLNKTCQSYTDCNNPLYDRTWKCVNKKCGCDDNEYVATVTALTGEKALDCIVMPNSLGQTCDGICRKPFICDVPNETDLKNFVPSGNGTVCVCRPPYIWNDTNTECYSNCKPNEYYEDFKCKKRCEWDSVKTEDGSCIKVALLDQSCKDTTQCTAPFSECRNGKCACYEGFKADVENNFCETQINNCPFGEALRISNSIVKCEINATEAKLQTPGKSPFICPDGYFCHGTAAYFPTTVVGHCCPRAKLTCPNGVPLPNANRMDSNGTYSCPLLTHFFHSAPGAGADDGVLCCPKMCPEGQVFAKEQCYIKKNYGDECSVDEQCDTGFGAVVCKQNNIFDKKSCVCSKGRKVSFRTSTLDGVINAFCVADCGVNEIALLDNSCAKIAKLGESCDYFTSLCSNSAECTVITKKCACKCGTKPIDDRNCGPE